MFEKLKGVCVILVAASFFAGCASGPAWVGPRPHQPYTAGEKVEGSGCGLLLFGIIPIMANSRTERAYDEAIGERAQSLTDTEVQQSWYTIPGAGLLLCTTVEGRLVP